MSLQTGDKINLYNLKTKSYLSYPIRSGNWDTGACSFDSCPHYIQNISKDSGILHSGEIIRIESTVASYENYKYLYCSQAGWVWYDKKSDNSKQYWRIVKQNAKTIGEEILSGDVVYLENVWFPDNYLYDDGNGYAACFYNKNDTWEITKSLDK